MPPLFVINSYLFPYPFKMGKKKSSEGKITCKDKPYLALFLIRNSKKSYGFNENQ